jgi:hypothetical protein
MRATPIPPTDWNAPKKPGPTPRPGRWREFAGAVRGNRHDHARVRALIMDYLVCGSASSATIAEDIGVDVPVVRSVLSLNPEIFMHTGARRASRWSLRPAPNGAGA